MTSAIITLEHIKEDNGWQQKKEHHQYWYQVVNALVSSINQRLYVYHDFNTFR